MAFALPFAAILTAAASAASVGYQISQGKPDAPSAPPALPQAPTLLSYSTEEPKAKSAQDAAKESVNAKRRAMLNSGGQTVFAGAAPLLAGDTRGPSLLGG